MTILEILDLLHDSDDRVNARLYFTRKRNQSTYDSYSPVVSCKVVDKLINLIIQALDKKREAQVCGFSPIGAYGDTLEQYETTDLMNYEAVMNSYLEEVAERDQITPEIVNKLSFYCFSIDWLIGETPVNVKFFRRITKFKKLSSKGFFGHISGNAFSIVESDMMGVDGDIDIVVKGREMLILNHVSMERIFSMTEQYIQKAGDAIEKVRAAGRISNFEQFAKDCLQDKRVSRILTKMLQEEEHLGQCFGNFENVKNVINIFELNIDTETVNGKECLIYENKGQLMDMVRLIRDSYYTSMIQERYGIDDSL